ncbi:MAG TPA: hypothetical protein VLI04_16410, partial [Nocardioidaceae bacterium]|nr:hypothetical protein [Nocardioidaceae bacterium]
RRERQRTSVSRPTAADTATEPRRVGSYVTSGLGTVAAFGDVPARPAVVPPARAAALAGVLRTVLVLDSA